MNPDIPAPGGSLSAEYPWPRYKPIFSGLACVMALFAAAAVFAWQFKRQWTPLERYYFPAFVRTAHVSASRNPYLRPARTWEVLVIRFHARRRFAVDRDVRWVPAPPGARKNALAFTLAPSAIEQGATGLAWESVRLNDSAFHAWLGYWIFGGRSLRQLLRTPCYAGFLDLGVLLPLAIGWDRRKAAERRQPHRLRGANLASRTGYHRGRRNLTGIGWMTKGPASVWERLHMAQRERKVVRISRRTESEHILIMGDTGSGKSSLIRQLLHQIAARGDTAIVYDPAIEYMPEFFDSDRGDVVLNPLDARMPYWSPSNELLHDAEADTLAKSLYPDGDRELEFFVDSPRRVFAYLMKFRPTPEDLCQWIEKPDTEIRRRLAHTSLAAYIEETAPQQRAGVIAGLDRFARAIQLLPLPTTNCREWSATKWSEERAGWLFFTSTPPTRDRLKPLISLWLDFLIMRLTAQTHSPQRPVWVIIDELASLQKLPTLLLALTESRKSNTRIVIGFQGKSLMEKHYGQEAETMLSQPRTRFFLRTAEANAAEWASRSVGDVEVEHVRRGQNTGPWGMERGKSATVDRRTERAILASEISDLEDLTGYFKVPGYTLRLEFAPIPPRLTQPVTIFRNAPDYSVPPLTKVPAENPRRQRRTAGHRRSDETAPEAVTSVNNDRGLERSEPSGDTYSTVDAKQ